MSTPDPTSPPSDRLVRNLTLVVTNMVKLGGLYVAIHEISTQPQPRLAVMAIALFMMTGAQVSEEAVLKLASRVFGTSSEGPKT